MVIKCAHSDEPFDPEIYCYRVYQVMPMDLCQPDFLVAGESQKDALEKISHFKKNNQFDFLVEYTGLSKIVADSPGIIGICHFDGNIVAWEEWVESDKFNYGCNEKNNKST